MEGRRDYILGVIAQTMGHIFTVFTLAVEYSVSGLRVPLTASKPDLAMFDVDRTWAAPDQTRTYMGVCSEATTVLSQFYTHNAQIQSIN